MIIIFITSIITISIILTSSYPVIVDMYIVSLQYVSGLIPPTESLYSQVVIRK